MSGGLGPSLLTIKMYLYSVLLLLATLSNFFHSYIIQDFFPYQGSWYDWIHKIQLLIILFSSFQYQHNWVNFLAAIGYIGIVIMNWIFHKLGWFTPLHFISTATSILYCLSLVVVLLIEKWKNP